jgi:hypothetical protein
MGGLVWQSGVSTSLKDLDYAGPVKKPTLQFSSCFAEVLGVLRRFMGRTLVFVHSDDSDFRIAVQFSFLS